MSGCATCVYDLYLEDLEHYHDALASARKLVVDKLRARRGLGTEAWRAAWPAELGTVDEALEDVDEGAAGKGGREKEEEAKKRAEKELQRTREQLDPAMRAFLEMEARMKAKQRERETSSPPAAS
ncbi:hypothetical protein Rhopal_006371-T1 [Rhodotorula paludigena]|uniref:Oxidoreductase-like domain-containing protein n=1 Tax=Rhodotorula paludigena TaxID=86838 RepID=A0AAV5GS41_9BASI|nr:hypothetical protein Rhopal_006371-T1 [Rhodotorula paludigena]